jgi:hypothetical protein
VDIGVIAQSRLEIIIRNSAVRIQIYADGTMMVPAIVEGIARGILQIVEVFPTLMLIVIRMLIAMRM